MRPVALILLGSLLAGCARTPPVIIKYPYARSALHVEIVQSLACDSSNMPVVVNTVTPTMLHMADADPKATGSIDLGGLDGPLSNSEFKTDFYADGRLKAINVTTTGQGEGILKTAIGLIRFAGEAPPPVDPKPICQTFRKAFGDKALSVTYELTHGLATSETSLVPIPPEHASRAQYELYKDLLGKFCLQVPRARLVKPPTTYTPGRGDVIVTARQPAMVEAAVTVGPRANCAETALWSGLVPAGQHGFEYKIPVPRAAIFGKQVFAASFEESGAISSLQYNKDTGAGQLLNVVEAAAKEIQTTDEEEAAKVKAKADLIAAQQRLVRCQANPSTCQ